MRLAAIDSRLPIIASAIRHSVRASCASAGVGRVGTLVEEGALAARAMMAKPKYEQAIPFG